MQPRRDIDDYCYKGNRKLKEPVLPPNCKIVGREAFANSQIRKLVTFPETLEEIREGAFSENRFLKEVIFPASLESIGAYCYKNCTALETVKFKAGSKCHRIPEGCFLFLPPAEQHCVSEKFKDHTKTGFLPLQRTKRDHTAGYPDKDRSRSILLLSH